MSTSILLSLVPNRMLTSLFCADANFAVMARASTKRRAFIKESVVRLGNRVHPFSLDGRIHGMNGLRFKNAELSAPLTGQKLPSIGNRLSVAAVGIKLSL